MVVKATPRHGTIFGIVGNDRNNVKRSWQKSIAEFDDNVIDGSRCLVVTSQVVVPHENQQIIAGSGNMEGARLVLPCCAQV